MIISTALSQRTRRALRFSVSSLPPLRTITFLPTTPSLPNVPKHSSITPFSRSMTSSSPNPLSDFHKAYSDIEKIPTLCALYMHEDSSEQKRVEILEQLDQIYKFTIEKGEEHIMSPAYQHDKIFDKIIDIMERLRDTLLAHRDLGPNLWENNWLKSSESLYRSEQMLIYFSRICLDTTKLSCRLAEILMHTQQYNTLQSKSYKLAKIAAELDVDNDQATIATLDLFSFRPKGTFLHACFYPTWDSYFQTPHNIPHNNVFASPQAFRDAVTQSFLIAIFRFISRGNGKFESPSLMRILRQIIQDKMIGKACNAYYTQRSTSPTSDFEQVSLALGKIPYLNYLIEKEIDGNSTFSSEKKINEILQVYSLVLEKGKEHIDDATYDHETLLKCTMTSIKILRDTCLSSRDLRLSVWWNNWFRRASFLYSCEQLRKPLSEICTELAHLSLDANWGDNNPSVPGQQSYSFAKMAGELDSGNKDAIALATDFFPIGAPRGACITHGFSLKKRDIEKPHKDFFAFPNAVAREIRNLFK